MVMATTVTMMMMMLLMMMVVVAVVMMMVVVTLTVMMPTINLMTMMMLTMNLMKMMIATASRTLSDHLRQTSGLKRYQLRHILDVRSAFSPSKLLHNPPLSSVCSGHENMLRESSTCFTASHWLQSYSENRPGTLAEAKPEVVVPPFHTSSKRSTKLAMQGGCSPCPSRQESQPRAMS